MNLLSKLPPSRVLMISSCSYLMDMLPSSLSVVLTSLVASDNVLLSRGLFFPIHSYLSWMRLLALLILIPSVSFV